MSTWPSVMDALEDGHLRGQDRRVYAICLRELALHEYRPMKQILIAYGVRTIKGIGAGQPISTAHVRRSLRRLAASGYLAKGPLQNGVRMYMLTYSRSNGGPPVA